MTDERLPRPTFSYTIFIYSQTWPFILKVNGDKDKVIGGKDKVHGDKDKVNGDKDKVNRVNNKVN